MNFKTLLKKFLWSLLILFLLMNVVAFFHAYRFTHFTGEKRARAKKNESQLSLGETINALVFGVNHPKPLNTSFPSQPFETITLQSNKKIECWSIKADSSKGTFIIFHGYGGKKSSMLVKSDEFLKMGYSTLLVDFMGSGGSEGNQTTIGYKEAQQVKTCFDYVKESGENRIYLFGTSMGAVAVLKAIHDYNLSPAGIIIECPFGTMYQTTCARFRNMGVPSFPMAGILVFWGGVQNGFSAFSHNPAEYAETVQCPALLLYGEQDDKVSREETDAIFENLQGKKTLKTYPLAGHENYLLKYKGEWVSDISDFLEKEVGKVVNLTAGKFAGMESLNKKQWKLILTRKDEKHEFSLNFPFEIVESMLLDSEKNVELSYKEISVNGNYSQRVVSSIRLRHKQ